LIAAIGWIATALFASSYLFKRPAALRKVQALAAALWVVYGLVIHAAPVVDGARQMVGIVSFVELSARPGRRVRDVMTVDPASVAQDASLEEAAALMLDQMVRQVPVVEAGRVVGILSTADIIRVFLSLREGVPARTGTGSASRARRHRHALPRGRRRRSATPHDVRP
jgi:CBS domain-containing protein